MYKTLKQIRRAVVAVVGFTLLLIGVVMIVLPGPAIVVIPVALAILGTEFVWAKRLLVKMKDRVRKKSQLPGRGADTHDDPPDKTNS